MTVPVWKKGLGLQKINDVRICYDFRWTRKHLASLKVAYANAPYFPDHLGFVEELFSSRFERLTELNLKVIRYLLNELQIRTEVVLLSELGIEAKGGLLPIEICRKIGGTRFLTQDSARKISRLGPFQSSGHTTGALKGSSPPSIRNSGEILFRTSRHSISSSIAGQRHETY